MDAILCLQTSDNLLKFPVPGNSWQRKGLLVFLFPGMTLGINGNETQEFAGTGMIIIVIGNSG